MRRRWRLGFAAAGNDFGDGGTMGIYGRCWTTRNDIPPMDLFTRAPTSKILSRPRFSRMPVNAK